MLLESRVLRGCSQYGRHSCCSFYPGRQVTPERYMEAIAAMQPDMFVALADEVREGL